MPLISLPLPAPGGEGLYVAVLLALWPFSRSRKRAPGTPSDARSLPPLMLLNLAPGDTQDDIESAPPLGSQDEVREQLSAALPGIVFDQAGHGTFTAGAGSVDVDLRTEEPVYTAVLTVRGAAGPVLAKLLDETGWRAYAPKPGAFVSAADVRRGRRA